MVSEFEDIKLTIHQMADRQVWLVKENARLRQELEETRGKFAKERELSEAQYTLLVEAKGELKEANARIDEMQLHWGTVLNPELYAGRARIKELERLLHDC